MNDIQRETKIKSQLKKLNYLLDKEYFVDFDTSVKEFIWYWERIGDKYMIDYFNNCLPKFN